LGQGHCVLGVSAAVYMSHVAEDRRRLEVVAQSQMLSEITPAASSQHCHACAGSAEAFRLALMSLPGLGQSLKLCHCRLSSWQISTSPQMPVLSTRTASSIVVMQEIDTSCHGTFGVEHVDFLFYSAPFCRTWSLCVMMAQSKESLNVSGVHLPNPMGLPCG
jgi:hypothetical protein